MAAIAIRYGRQASDGTIDREASQAHALPTSEGDVVWVNVPVPSPIATAPVLFVELPADHTLADAVGVPPADYGMGWAHDSGTRYTFEPAVAVAEATWLTTFIAEPTAGIRQPDVLELGLGRLAADGTLHAGSDSVAQAVVTTEGDVYWLSVPLQTPTDALPGYMFVDLPTGYAFLSATSLTGTAFEADGWTREGATDRYVYRPDVAFVPVAMDTPWPTTILARPRVSEITIGVNGYCVVGDVIRASKVPNAARQDVIAFITNGFDHINALFNISSRELRLVPPHNRYRSDRCT